MKMGTDAILLGIWVDVSNAKTILDVCTVCGIIPLMLAERSQAKFDAIDNDPDSIEEASVNFKHSPRAGRIHPLIYRFKTSGKTQVQGMTLL